MIGTSQLINTFSRPCFTDTTDIFKDGSGVALYGLDYDASDAGGASGKFGEAAIFNGSSSYINTNYTLTSSTTFTWSAWINTSNTKNTYVAGDFNPAGSNFSHRFSVRIYNQVLQASVNDSAGGVGTSISFGTFAHYGSWAHLVVTIDGTTVKGYVNGSQLGSTGTSSQSLAAGANPLTLGMYGSGGTGATPFDGSIDQVRIFDTALTQSQVTQLYQENSSTVGTHLFGCIANYNLDGSAKESMGTTAYDGVETDITYRYDGTPTAVGFGVGGKTNYGAGFNGSSSYIDTGISTLTSAGGSVSLWVKTTDTTASFFGTNSNSDTNRFYFGVRDSKFWIGAGNTQSYTVSASNLIDGNWHNVVLTLDGSTAKYYLDGASTPVASTSYSGGGVCNVNPVIGGLRTSSGINSSYYTNGSIDQVRIFSKALSSAEVGKLYGNGAGEIACAYTSTTDNSVYPIANTAYYKLDNNSKDSARSTGKFNEGAIFNGSSSKIQSNVLQSTNMTFSFWFKTTTTGESEYLMGFNTSGSAGYITTRLNTNDTIGIAYWNGSTYAAVSSSAITRDTNYNHICITISGTSYTIYYNGSSIGSGTLSGFLASSRTDFVMGFDAPTGTTSYMDGSLDQVRIYNTALDSTDVSNLYAETVSDTSTLSFPSGKTAIATYQLDGNSTDLSGNYNGTDTNVTYAYDGTESNIEYRFGRYGQAAVFNGSSSYITSNSLPSIGTGDFTFSCWFNQNSGNQQGALFSTTTQWFAANGYDGKVLMVTDDTVTKKGDTTYSQDTWNHAVFARESGVLKIYQNGTEVFSGAYTDSWDMTQFGIGVARAFGSRVYYFNGKIDQVRIFSSALTSSQVTQLYEEKPEVDTSNFKTVLYEGNGDTTNPTYISNVGIDLETNGGLVWAKSRTTAYNHLLMDSVRGTTSLTSNDTTAERTNYNRFQGYEANGFSILANNVADLYKINRVGHDYVAWVWKGGGDDVLNEEGTIDSQVSANTEAGFSIVKYTGNTGVDQTVGTGLTTPCDIVIVKRLTDSGYSWCVGGSVVGNGNNMYLDSIGELLVRDRIKSVQSETFTVEQVHEVNNTGKDYIAYCWHSVAGYSKIWTYTGNASTKLVYTDSNDDGTGTGGFEPSFVMIRSTSASRNWTIFDNKRFGTHGYNDKYIRANTFGAEIDSSDNDILEFTNTGFTLRATDLEVNGSGETYIYMAFK